jgi:aminoglycoside phosphotransferase (APT) family kinase protein
VIETQQPIILHGDMDRKVFAWLENNLGKVTLFAPHARWRTGWDAEVSRDGELRPLYIRGPRGDNYTSPINMAQEAAIHRAYLANDIPVPKVIGLIEDPEALVLERISGIINTGAIADAGSRKKIREEFVEIMAAIVS